jgi:hypothetical protein
MRTIEKTIYTFDELDECAKSRAREWYRNGLEYPFFDDAKSSLKAFCDEFRVEILDYRLGDYRGFVKTDASNANFRGFKLSQFDREAMPTGMCFDCSLRYTFADEFKKYGDALNAFKSALNAFTLEIERDVEYQLSDEAVEESIEANGYEFDEGGHLA